TLPDDILHVFCEEIARQRDFDTLFRCAQAGKRLATPALTHLYRNQQLWPGLGGNDSVPQAEQLLLVQKWSILWRSLIASALGTTLFPYCKFLHVLDLRDLTYLLEDDKFHKVSKRFFAGEVAKFNITVNKATSSRVAGKTVRRLDIVAAIDAIGDVLSSALVKWAPRLARLKALELWEGRALADEGAQKAILENCPRFDSLKFMLWFVPQADADMSKFIRGMQTQKLRWFETFNRADIGAETCLALSGHGTNLKTLKLNLKTEGLQHLGLLKGCTKLETLELEHIEERTHPTDLEQEHNDVFHEMLDWLRQCTSLRTLTFGGFPSAPALCTPLLLHNDTRLHSLKVDMYNAGLNQDFQRALGHQPDLQSLSLTSEPDQAIEHPDTIIQSICQCKKLRDLKLTGVSDTFDNPHIDALARGLPNLEDFYFTGDTIQDQVLISLAGLKNLKRVDMAALTDFTFLSLMRFVRSLGPGNRGIEIIIAAALPSTMLSNDQIECIRAEVDKRLDGRFDYQPYR
ncbi:hypothetical protein K490DRAFT_18894, partial [Saccharata proteae CBS 121410]